MKNKLLLALILQYNFMQMIFRKEDNEKQIVKIQYISVIIEETRHHVGKSDIK